MNHTQKLHKTVVFINCVSLATACHIQKANPFVRSMVGSKMDGQWK